MTFSLTGFFLLLLATQSGSGEDANGVVKNLFLHADQLVQAGRYGEAHETSLQAIAVAGNSSPSSPIHAAALNQLGHICNFLGRYDDAEKAFKQAISIVENDPGQRALLSQALQRLSSIYMDYGARYQQAERLLNRALELSMDSLESDPNRGGVLLADLGTAHMMQRHDSEARQILLRSLAILEQRPEWNQVNIAGVLANLGVLAFRQGETDGALQYLRRAIALYENSLPSNHPELLRPLINLGRVHGKLKNWAMVEDSFRHALEIAESVGDRHPLFAEVLTSYAEALRHNGKKSESRKMAKRAAALVVPSSGHLQGSTVHVSELVNDKAERSRR